MHLFIEINIPSSRSDLDNVATSLVEEDLEISLHPGLLSSSNCISGGSGRLLCFGLKTTLYPENQSIIFSNLYNTWGTSYR